LRASTWGRRLIWRAATASFAGCQLGKPKVFRTFPHLKTENLMLQKVSECHVDDPPFFLMFSRRRRALQKTLRFARHF
jgi:hypothetical protein